jgi:hypothetical protein
LADNGLVDDADALDIVQQVQLNRYVAITDLDSSVRKPRCSPVDRAELINTRPRPRSGSGLLGKLEGPAFGETLIDW